MKPLSHRAAALCLALGLLAPGACHSASPAPVADVVAPIMTLDPGTHTGPIRRIAVNADQTILATVSDDKSARLWDIASGKLVATLHPPAGANQIGRLYGVAISGDNRVAIAGTTAASGGVHRIHVFDLLSHAYLKSFDARGGNIKRLEWSPDGRMLAAAYADSPAVRVFDDQGALVFEEPFSSDAYCVTFSSTHRMAVSATDGKIHLYSLASGNRVTADGTIAVSLNDPRSIDFSPDGSLLAVGYLSRTGNDQVRVDVYDVASRRLRQTFAFSDVSRGNLMNVAWQSDGRAMYAGGTGYRGRNQFIVKRIGWPEGDAVDIDAGVNSILDFATLRDGTMVFATAEPAWGLIRHGRATTVVRAFIAQFYEASMLRINQDATEITWRYRLDEAPVRFNLAQRRILDGAGDASLAAEPSTWGVRVTDWENNFNPKINGRSVALEKSEIARAAAVLPRNAGVILGSSRSLRRFDPDGKERWVVLLPTEVRAVNISADGAIVVVAMLDGTIHWHRAADGAPLLSLFTTRDRKWVMWTELGYFDVGAGAEDLVGWLVNRSGGEQADYYPISRFRDKYLRPDVIDRVLRSGDQAAAVASANNARQAQAAAADASVRQRVQALVAPEAVESALPPALTLLSPAVIESSDTQVSVDYRVLSQAGKPVTSVSVRVDGRPYGQFSNRLPSSADASGTGKLALTLPEKNSHVQIFAVNAIGISAPATFSYRWRAPPAPPPRAIPDADKRPRLYLLGVGVSRYANAKYNLDFAAKDASDFARTLRGQEGAFYREVDVRLLADEQATRANILEGLRWLGSVTTPDDVGMLYLAGHGINDVDDSYYFLPHDFDLKHLAGSSISEEALREVLTRMKGKSIFFVDTCYSGKAVGAISTPDLTRVSNRFSSPEYGIIVFSASYGRQESIESEIWGNGAFTKALVDGLLGRADYRHDGFVTHKGLDYYVSNEVKKLTSGAQTPVTTVPVGLADFALARVLQ